MVFVVDALWEIVRTVDVAGYGEAVVCRIGFRLVKLLFLPSSEGRLVVCLRLGVLDTWVIVVLEGDRPKDEICAEESRV